MKFGLLEIGSTNTKAYLFDGKNLINYGSKFIAIKNNYKKYHEMINSDKEELFSYAKELKEKVNEVYAFGTSSFRIMDEKDQKEIIKQMKQETGINLRIMTADEESEYTVKGVVGNIDYDKKIAIMIGGGGSTEIAIVENREIIDKINLDFGSMDVTNWFPELNEDIVNTPFEKIWNKTNQLIGNINHKVDALVLAGGDYIYFYETVGYEMEQNHLYQDKNQPYLIIIKKSDEYDHDILKRSLDSIKASCPGNENWWIGARGMRFCVNPIAHKLNVKYIIPTRINMLIGLAEEIKNLQVNL